MMPGNDARMEQHQPTTYELAGVGRRFIASLIDGIILQIFNLIITTIWTRIRSAQGTEAEISAFSSIIVGILIAVGYYLYFWTLQEGQTPGKAAMSIRIIKANGEPLNISDVIVRYSGYWVSGIFLGLGYLWALFDEHNQAWHDKMASTYVVMARNEKPKKTVTINID